MISNFFKYKVPPSNPVIKYTVNNGQYIEKKSKTYDQIDLIENDSVDLDCSPGFSGNPLPNIVWLKNGYMYSKQPKVELRNLSAENHLDNFTCLIYSDALEEPLRINVKLFLYCKLFFIYRAILIQLFIDFKLE